MGTTSGTTSLLKVVPRLRTHSVRSRKFLDSGAWTARRVNCLGCLNLRDRPDGAGRRVLPPVRATRIGSQRNDGVSDPSRLRMQPQREAAGSLTPSFGKEIGSESVQLLRERCGHGSDLGHACGHHVVDAGAGLGVVKVLRCAPTSHTRGLRTLTTPPRRAQSWLLRDGRHMERVPSDDPGPRFPAHNASVLLVVHRPTRHAFVGQQTIG